MKKQTLSLLLFLVTCVFLTSCSNENGDEPIKNPLSGSLWSFNDNVLYENEKFTRYIEFVDDKIVKVWDTFEGSFGGVYSGTYSVEGNKVRFSNLYDKYWWWSYVEGTFTSNTMKVLYKYPDDDYLYDNIYIKQ